MADLRLPTLNRVLLTGRLTRDCELRYTPSGVAVTNFSIACNRRYKDQSGEWRDETTFVGIVAWQRLAERCGEYLHKGSAIMVEGRLHSRSWETEDGQRRSILEVRADRVEFLDRLGAEERAAATATTESPKADEPETTPGTDDDVPF
ncbi:MAG: hypothetical protein AMJ46_07510 [Latescibacteria bacterium DG_63]|uniref:Single-stranded DNA-binding protein n=2 Tax=Bacteria division TA06 TaxID=1156500 RepID=A0A0S8JME6_UNCT6|nr:MAG: hypothetical protein AMJ46_07510 [Latescibacteria bacterium DG_63]KPK69143.1 MAG: hypothetical protein AMJ82_06395 [candidate division TA06 bacterium SM23_40]KPL10889.1 MAG: hypothetical protein AMJ71_01455 [candidate division TA06 bacterium SM1_40]